MQTLTTTPETLEAGPPAELGVFGLSDRDVEGGIATGHEQVVYCRDEATGLRAVVAIHSTVLGPALGGTRFQPYPDEWAALRDVLRLSEGMACKAAAAGLPLGGGKAVILGDARQLKTHDLLAAYGRFINRLGGHYVTAADVGTSEEDLDVIATQTRHVVGTSATGGGSGDSGLSTARGVFEAMRAAAELRWGTSDLAGQTVGVEGVGKVGKHLVDLLVGGGARVVVADPDGAAVDAVVHRHGSLVAARPTVADAEVDIYAPCGLGGVLTSASVAQLRAEIVCGAANNQLASTQVDRELAERGVLWVPDYVANAGGLIQVGGEHLGHTTEQVQASIAAIRETTLEIIEAAAAENIPTGQAGAAVVDARLARGTQEQT